MWLSTVENPLAIKSVYKDQTPLLDEIIMNELLIKFGEVNQISLKFDLEEMPLNRPLKWIENSVNTVQIELALIDSEVVFFEGRSNKGLKGQLEITIQNEFKIISFLVNHIKFFSIKCRWINVRSLTGYRKNNVL